MNINYRFKIDENIKIQLVSKNLFFSFFSHFLEDFEMNTHDINETNDPISIQQAELRQKDEQADVEAIHDVRLLSLHTAQLKFQSPPTVKKNLKDAKQCETTVFDSFDEFCKS